MRLTSTLLENWHTNRGGSFVEHVGWPGDHIQAVAGELDENVQIQQNAGALKVVENNLHKMTCKYQIQNGLEEGEP